MIDLNKIRMVDQFKLKDNMVKELTIVRKLIQYLEVPNLKIITNNNKLFLQEDKIQDKDSVTMVLLVQIMKIQVLWVHENFQILECKLYQIQILNLMLIETESKSPLMQTLKWIIKIRMLGFNNKHNTINLNLKRNMEIIKIHTFKNFNSFSNSHNPNQ